MNRENLQRMADYIRTIPPEKFDMKVYRSNLDGFLFQTERFPVECKSVGCVVGHCTILDPTGFVNAQREAEIKIDAFSIWAIKFTSVTMPQFNWCFDCGWAFVDNTRGGAALRIEWLLKNGLPVTADYQRRGLVPLCYK